MKNNNFTTIDAETASKITFNQFNRLVKHTHVNEIAKSMNDNSFKYFAPIIVNTETNHVLDGQHRLKAYLKAIENGSIKPDTKIKVMYVNVPEGDDEINLITAYNSNSKNWSLDEFVDSYIKQGKESYIKLNDFCQSHILCKSNVGKSNFRYGYAIITGKGGQGTLKQGNITITEEDLKFGETIHEEIMEFVKVLEFSTTGNWIEAFALVWYENRNYYTLKEWVKEFKRSKNQILLDYAKKDFRWNDCFDKAFSRIAKRLSNTNKQIVESARVEFERNIPKTRVALFS